MNKLILVKRLIIVLCVPLLLVACQKADIADSQAAHTVPADSVTVSVDEVNYNADLEIKYSAFDLSSSTPDKAIAGGIVVPLAAGGAKSCCVNLPMVWRTGIKIKVEWQEADKEIKPEIYRQTVELPRYDQPGDVYVIFHPEHQLEVLASPVEPQHPNWQGKTKVPPLEACLKKNTNKFCMQSFPKYRPNSHEAIAAGYRKSCTEKRLLSSNDPKGNREACRLLIEDCRKNWRIDDKKMCELDYKE